ncbi:MAG: hypothetical protein HFH58_07050 [Lachnospiraceae bacterium]|nr:hypothetical protein [Lachnospiraceae bacterium]
MSFRKYREALYIEREYPLMKEPPRMDFLVIKKEKDTVIDNAVGKIFRKHNVVENKNPNDSLNSDVVWKVIGYAGLYKGLAEHVNEIPAEELTISIFRNRCPRELFKEWKREGMEVSHPYSGVYYVKGVVSLPLQIIVANELEGEEFLSLRMLMPGVKEKEIRKFLSYMNTLQDLGDRRDAEAVLRVSVTANVEMYEKAGREDEMVNQVVWRLFGDEIEKAVEEKLSGSVEEAIEKAVADEKVSNIRSIMGKFHLTEQEAMNALDVPPYQQAKYTEELSKKVEHKKG